MLNKLIHYLDRFFMKACIEIDVVKALQEHGFSVACGTGLYRNVMNDKFYFDRPKNSKWWESFPVFDRINPAYNSDQPITHRDYRIEKSQPPLNGKPFDEIPVGRIYIGLIPTGKPVTASDRCGIKLIYRLPTFDQNTHERLMQVANKTGIYYENSFINEITRKQLVNV